MATASRQPMSPTAIRALESSTIAPAIIHGERLRANCRRASASVFTSRPQRAGASGSGTTGLQQPSEEPPRLGLTRLGEDLLGRADLDQLALVEKAHEV